MLKNIFVCTALFAQICAALALPASAQSPAPLPTPAAATSQLTARVVGIDYHSRLISLQDRAGIVRDFVAGPEVKRFNNIKVGDTVTFTYTESVALAFAKPGAATPAASPSTTMTSYPGSKPGGAISETQTTTVTIQAIDNSKPQIRVKTQDGRILDLLVQDRKNLNGLKVGDVVQVTYSQSLIVTVK